MCGQNMNNFFEHLRIKNTLKFQAKLINEK